jgi:hypothetical protein
MLAGPLILALIVAVFLIDRHDIAHELAALAKLAFILAPFWMLLLFVPAVVGALPFLVIRKFAPHNKIARPLFILVCFAFIWLICMMALAVESQFTNISPYFPSPHPPILTQLRDLLTTKQLASLICVVISGALVCWRIDAHTKTNEPNVAASAGST